MRRNPVLLRILLVAPLVQLILFGYAATTDVKDLPVIICDESHSQPARHLAAEIDASYYFTIAGHLADHRHIKEALDSGLAQMAIHIPHDFARRLRRSQSSTVGLYVDGSDPITASIALPYLTGLLRDCGMRMDIYQANRPSALPTGPAITPEPRVWYNPDLRSANFMVPGVFGLIIMIVTTVWTSQSIVRERELGTLEQLLVTPIKALELLIGKSLPYAVAAMLDAGVIVIIAVHWFAVPLRGQLLFLFALAAVFVLTTLGTGLLISTISRTQQQALLTAFFFLMPAVLLSGFMFPIDNMPWVMQQLTYLIPYRYFLEICRGVFLKGTGLSILWPQCVALAVFGVTLFAAGALAFRKRL